LRHNTRHSLAAHRRALSSSNEDLIIDTIAAEWLPVILQGSSSEIYVLECESLRFRYANPAALANLQYSASELSGMRFTALAAPTEDVQRVQLMETLCRGRQTTLEWHTRHVRKDGSSYPIEFRLFHLTSSGGPVVIAIGNDVSSRDESDQALRARDSRLNAVVSNTPGLVYQFQLQPDGSYAFPYLSDGCEALLGLPAAELQERPEIFLQLILPEDRPSYLSSMQASTQAMTNWNWEGRIWIEKWNDVKWINLRATPRALAEGNVRWEGIMTNITASKLEQEELTRSRAAGRTVCAH
jgi:two-component system sensor histidine kinase UhpB